MAPDARLENEMANQKKRPSSPILIILAAFVILAFAASVINPLHEATDELRHYRFVQHIVQRQALPVQGAMGCSAQGHHPPLFYALGAIATFWVDTGRDICYQPPTNPFWQYRYWEVGQDNKNQYLHGPDESFPWRGEALAAHLVRAVNILIGAGVVYLTWLLGRTIWPRRPWLAVGGAAFVAFNPMFVYMSAAINNDVLAALGGTAVTLACARLLADDRGLSRRWGVILGGLFGLALLSKFNLAATGILITAAVTWSAWRKNQWRLWLEVALIAAVITAMLAGWWFVRNQLLYGEPTGFERLTELWGARDPAQSFGVAVFELPYTWTSLWGRFGYGQVPLPEGVYRVLAVLVGASLLGFLVPLRRLRWREWGREGVLLLLLVLDVLLFFVVLFNYLLVSPAGAMGRFFFPALPALALLTFYGLTQWVTWWDKNATAKRTALLVNSGMALLTVAALGGYLAPAYARPPAYGENTAVPNPLGAQFDNFVRLNGYEISETNLTPGNYLELTLYWEVLAPPPGNFLYFVHLTNAAGILVAQRDTHPGLGNFPSSQWRAGERFVETIRIHATETLYTPQTAVLSLGLYAPGEGYRLGIIAADGRGLGDALVLAEINLMPAEIHRDDGQTFPNQLVQNFSDEIRLVGYEYDTLQPRPGGMLAVILYWEALKDGLPPYETAVSLCSQSCPDWETPRSVSQSVPQNGAAPTGGWRVGEIISETHMLPIPADLEAGQVAIYVALIDQESGLAQNIIADDGHWIDNRLLLSSVRIVE